MTHQNPNQIANVDFPMLSPHVSSLCPVCHYTIAVRFFDGGRHPLATLGWPANSVAAQSMACYPLDFVQCPRCTHVWNRSFKYEDIPYISNPNRMFNTGTIWRGHLTSTRDVLLTKLPTSPTVIEIGCGEGHFLRGMAGASSSGRFIGFDPNVTTESGRDIEFIPRYFDPLTDIHAYQPDAIIMRHVLEHLTDPAAFLEQLAWGAASLEKAVWFFAETPCIDRVFNTDRLADFFYEHPSHFTTRSFQVLMDRGGGDTDIGHGYDGEVVYGLVRLGVSDAFRSRSEASALFASRATINRGTIRAQIDMLCTNGLRVAIWGGTGKAAAFMHQYGVDAERFPLVVDSDPDKVGTFVPGTGQQIAFRDVLKTHPADVIIIPTQWRARDIAAEMSREHIVTNTILIEHGGQLVDFSGAEHPYR